MLFVVWVPLLLQLIVPLTLLLWVAFGRPRSVLAWWVLLVLVSCYVVAIGAAGMWLVLPWYTPMIYGVTLVLAILHSLPERTLPLSPERRRDRIALGFLIGLTAIFGALDARVLSGQGGPDNAMELSFPLRGGTYLIVNGGSDELVNAHLKTLTGGRFRSWRGQSFGVDITKLNKYGMRASGILPSNRSRYAIFGEPVYAPCAGKVVAVTDGIPEMSPPRMDRQHMAGNHVVLECGDRWVLLGHLQMGSLRVHATELVETGQQLGRVGNTGNTGEPHLHVHVQTPGTPIAPLSGDPLPLRFGHRYPVRNARFDVS